eukprot:PhM_4_TR13321/c2_g3_i2/m.72658
MDGDPLEELRRSARLLKKLQEGVDSRGNSLSYSAMGSFSRSPERESSLAAHRQQQQPSTPTDKRRRHQDYYSGSNLHMHTNQKADGNDYSIPAPMTPPSMRQQQQTYHHPPTPTSAPIVAAAVERTYSQSTTRTSRASSPHAHFQSFQQSPYRAAHPPRATTIQELAAATPVPPVQSSPTTPSHSRSSSLHHRSASHNTTTTAMPTAPQPAPALHIEHVASFIERKAQDKIFGSPLPPAPSYFSPTRHRRASIAPWHTTPLGAPTPQQDWKRLHTLVGSSGPLPPPQYNSPSKRGSRSTTPLNSFNEKEPSEQQSYSAAMHDMERQRLEWEAQIAHRDEQFHHALSAEDRDFYNSFEALYIHEKEHLRAELRRLHFDET